MATGCAAEGLALVRAGLDLLLADDLSASDSSDVVETLRELEVLGCRLAGVDHRLVAKIGQRAIAGEYARSSVVDLLVWLLRVSPAEAKARVTRAGDLGPRRTLQGEPLPPLLPVVAGAVESGELSTSHVAVITACLEQLSSGVPAKIFEIVESTLVDAARHENPAALRTTAAMLLARVDPDGAQPRMDEAEQRRDVALVRHRDGSGRLTGRLTVEATAIWDTVLDSLSAPVPSDNGEPDGRTAGQRRHDALLDAGQRLLRSGSLPASGGVPVTVLVRVTDADLFAGRGCATTSRGDLWPVRDLLRSAGDAEIVPACFDDAGAVLRLGRTRRLASRAQRLALIARDGGCCFPGCDRPAAWTEVHHVIPWQDGGPTDVDNMCLLCRFHHRQFDSCGWQVQMTDGVPEWATPALARSTTTSSTQYRPPSARHRVRRRSRPCRLTFARGCRGFR